MSHRTSTASTVNRLGAVLVAVLVLALSACGGAASSGGESAQRTIAISFPNYARTPALQVEMEAAEERAAARGYRLVLDDPGSDLDKQVSTIQTWIPQRYAAIIAVALDAKALEGVAKQATAAGVKWITYGSALQNQTGEVDMQQQAGGRVLGEMAATWFNEQRGGTGKVAIFGYDEGEWARARVEGIEAALREKAPGVEVVARQNALSETEGVDAAANLLQAHPDLNGFLAVEDSATFGALKALPDPKSPDMFLGGMDGTKESLETIAAGDTAYRASAALDLAAIGAGMVDVAANAAEGTGPTTYSVSYLPATAGSPELEQALARWA
jgi:ribose transport system substrate-binding protein